VGIFIPLLLIGGGLWAGSKLSSDDSEINYNYEYNAPVNVEPEKGFVEMTLPYVVLGASGIAIYKFVSSKRRGD
jgi:hypothetical protein